MRITDPVQLARVADSVRSYNQGRGISPAALPAPPERPKPPPKVEVSPKASATPDGVILTRAADLEMVPISWLWPDWLACGKLHLLAGAPGQGKTTIALALAAAVSSGGRWPDGSRCPTGNVLFWSGEDDPADTLLPRLVAMGVDRSRVFFVTGARVDGEVLPFDPARDLVQLSAAAQAIGDVRLMVVDPIVSAVAGDSHKNTEVRRALQPLVDLASAMSAAIIGISHLSKGTAGRDPTERVTGSIAFTAIVRVVMMAAKVKSEDGDERRVLVRSKSNIGPDSGGFEYHLEQGEAAPGIPASMVTWGKPLQGTARELLREAESDAENEDGSTSGDDATDYLRDMLKGAEWTPSRDVVRAMKAEGYSDKVIRRAREKLGVKVDRKGFGSGMKSLWALPFLPSAAHSCPLMPTDFEGTNGQEWSPEGTNGGEAL